MKLHTGAVVACMAIICSLCFVQCKKDPSPDNSYGLPNATQTGANTFAAVLTNYNYTVAYLPFIADNDLNDPFYSTSGNGAQLNGDTLTISGAPQTGSYFQGIKFTITGNLQQGTIYTIGSPGITAVTGTDSTCQGISLSTVSAVADSGSVELSKFDVTNKIVSGTFTLNFPFPACFTTVYVTQGRFDYKYH